MSEAARHPKRAHSDLISPTSISSVTISPPFKRVAMDDTQITAWPTRTEENVSPREALQHRTRNEGLSHAYVSIHTQQETELGIP